MSRPDYLIIRAGPAGLQLANFLEKTGRGYLVREREVTAGAFFRSEVRQVEPGEPVEVA